MTEADNPDTETATKTRARIGHMLAGIAVAATAVTTVLVTEAVL